jgi:hypothetical protein
MPAGVGRRLPMGRCLPPTTWSRCGALALVVVAGYRKPSTGAVAARDSAAPMVRHPPPILAPLALLAALALPACHRNLSCTAEVTEAQGIFHGTVAGSRSQATLEREALRAACGQLCGAQGTAAVPGCVARCAVDAEAGKIGKRTTCVPGGSR